MDDRNDVVIKKSLRNIPLAIFYTILLVIAFVVFYYLDIRLAITISSSLLGYFILKSIFGVAIVTLKDESITLYSGVFDVGITSSISTKKLRRIYVKKMVGEGVTTAAKHADSVKQAIVFDIGFKKAFLKNLISLSDLVEFRNEIVKAVLLKYDNEQLPEWRASQDAYWYDFYKS